MIEFVLLDIDDTLLDFGKAEVAAVSRTFSELGIPSDTAMIRRYREINDEQWKLLERGEIKREEALVRRYKLLFDEYGITASPEKAEDRYEFLLGIGHYFVDGAPELLQALCGKYRLFIVSNGTGSVQDSRIESAGIAKYFENIFISERLGADKPSAKFFELCFEGGILRIQYFQILVHLVIFLGKIGHVFICGTFCLKYELLFARIQFFDFFRYGGKLLIQFYMLDRIQNTGFTLL